MLFHRGVMARVPCQHCAKGKGRFDWFVSIYPRSGSTWPDDFFQGLEPIIYQRRQLPTRTVRLIPFIYRYED